MNNGNKTKLVRRVAAVIRVNEMTLIGKKRLSIAHKQRVISDIGFSKAPIAISAAAPSASQIKRYLSSAGNIVLLRSGMIWRPMTMASIAGEIQCTSILFAVGRYSR